MLPVFIVNLFGLLVSKESGDFQCVWTTKMAVPTKSLFPWQLSRVLKALFRGPRCCSLYQELTQTSITTALGTAQIMVGLFNIGLGPGRTSTSPGDLASLGAAYWLGAVFIVSGIMSILAGQFPSSCLMGFTVFMNIAAAIFAVTAMALYVVDLRNASLLWMCEQADHRGDNCTHVALLAQRLLTSMDVTSIAMAVLQLFVNIRFAVLGIRALTGETKTEEVRSRESEGGKDVEDLQPQLKDFLLISPSEENQLS